MNPVKATCELDDSADALAPFAAPRRTGVGQAAKRLMTNSDMHQGMLSIFDQAVVSGASFATSIIIGRLCTQAEVGVYALALSVVLLARGLQEQLVSTPYQILHHRRSGHAWASFAGSALIHQLGVTALISLGLLAFLACLSFGLGPVAVTPTIWVLVLVGPFLLLREYIRGLAISHLKMRTAIAIDVVVSVLQLAGLGLLGYFGHLTIPRAFGVMGIACAVAIIGWYAIDRPRWRYSVAEAWGHWQENWLLGRWALASHLVGCSMIYFMPWIMVFAQGEEVTGVLAVCTTLVGLSGMFVNGLSNFVSSRSAQAFAQGGIPAMWPVLQKTMLVFIMTLGGFSLLMLVAGGWIVTAIYGVKYAGSGPIVTVLAVSLLARSIGITAGHGLWAMGRPQASVSGDAVSLFVTLLVTLLSVHALGAMGAAIGTLAGNAAGSVVRSFTLWQLIRSESFAAKLA